MANAGSNRTPTATTVKVVIVGDSGVGKTSLVLRYVKNAFQPFQEPTIGAAFLSKTVAVVEGSGSSDGGIPENQSNRHDVHMKIWDTAGQERYQSLTPLYFRGAGAAILVYDICRMHSFRALQKWIRLVQENPSIELLIVVGNKSDLDAERSVQESDARLFAEEHGASLYVETSAKSDTNVRYLFEQLARRAAEVLPPDPPSAGQGGDANDSSGRIDLSASSSFHNTGGSCCYSTTPSYSQSSSESE